MVDIQGKVVSVLIATARVYSVPAVIEKAGSEQATTTTEQLSQPSHDQGLCMLFLLF